MKIISFSHDANLFGAQRSLLTLLTGLKKRNHDTTLVVPGEGDLTEALKKTDIDWSIIRYPYPSLKPHKFLSYLKNYAEPATKIRQIVNELKPDLVHFNTAACVAPAMALRKSSAKKIWHLRERAPQRWLLERLINRWSDHAIANCQDTGSAYHMLNRLGKISVVHNGLDLKPPKAEAVSQMQSKLGWKDGELTIAFAGNLLPHKNPLAVVEAVAILKERNIPCKACILGEGILKETVVQKIDQMGLTGEVILPGFVQNTSDYLAAADVVVIPSLVEPFPRVGLEAMALSKPIVGTTVGGMQEQTVSGETGMLVPPGNSEAIADALQKLAANKNLLLSLGQAGFRRYEESFTSEAYVNGFTAVIDKLS